MKRTHPRPLAQETPWQEAGLRRPLGRPPGWMDALPGWILPSVFTAFCEFAEQAAGVYHREARSGRYRLTYAEAKAVCEFEGGRLATYKQLEAARKIGNACDLRIFSFFTPGEGGIPPSCGPFTGSLSRASRSSRSPVTSLLSGSAHLLCPEPGGVLSAHHLPRVTKHCDLIELEVRGEQRLIIPTSLQFLPDLILLLICTTALS